MHQLRSAGVDCCNSGEDGAGLTPTGLFKFLYIAIFNIKLYVFSVAVVSAWE